MVTDTERFDPTVMSSLSSESKGVQRKGVMEPQRSGYLWLKLLYRPLFKLKVNLNPVVE